MSTGVAAYPELAVQSPTDLLHLADQALYTAKHLGRNLCLLDIGQARGRPGRDRGCRSRGGGGPGTPSSSPGGGGSGIASEPPHGVGPRKGEIVARNDSRWALILGASSGFGEAAALASAAAGWDVFGVH
ncbi:MAG: GGDEF domain-containing protein [Thermoanaerobaculia bacterium]